MLSWPGDSEGAFRSSNQATTCLPVYHTRPRLHTVRLIAEVKQESCEYQLLVFGLIQQGIEHESTASVADALSIQEPWVLEPAPVYVRKHVLDKYDPMLDEVDLLHANQNHAVVRYPEGREVTVSVRDVAPTATTPSNGDPWSLFHFLF